MCNGASLSNTKAQDFLRDSHLFQPIMSYLPIALDNMSNFEKITFFNEDMVSYVLDLLSQSLDGNKSNQDFILNNFKM